MCQHLCPLGMGQDLGSDSNPAPSQPLTHCVACGWSRGIGSLSPLSLICEMDPPEPMSPAARDNVMVRRP